jgi:hypothetical protein
MLLDPVSKIFTPFSRAYKAILQRNKSTGFGVWPETHFFAIPAGNDYRPSWFPPSPEQCPKSTHDFVQRRRPGSWVCCSHHPSCRGGIDQEVTERKERKEARTIAMIAHDYNLIMALVARLSTGDDSHDILDEGKTGY